MFFYTIDKCYKVVAVTKVIFLKLLLISHSAGIKGRVSVSQTSFPPINKEVNKTSKSMKVKNDHRSKFSNLSYWKEEA